MQLNIKPWTEEEIKNLEEASKRYEKRWQEANRIDFGAVKEAWEVAIARVENEENLPPVMKLTKNSIPKVYRKKEQLSLAASTIEIEKNCTGNIVFFYLDSFYIEGVLYNIFRNEEHNIFIEGIIKPNMNIKLNDESYQLRQLSNTESFLCQEKDKKNTCMINGEYLYEIVGMGTGDIKPILIAYRKKTEEVSIHFVERKG